jgi:DNA (cytosine-5)-methyltransferase 1
MTAYYNEIEPYCVAWLKNLIHEGLIADGYVDERSIVEVTAGDLAGFSQCHFFAGIGGWSYAARLAGWPDDRPLWSASCPCQPFSVAGKGAAQADARHLWPEAARLVRARRPPVLVGEQVAAAVGKSWLDGVRADLEGVGYAVRGVVVPACSVNAPHRRDRLWFVADANGDRSGAGRGDDGEVRSLSEAQRQPEHGAAVSRRGCPQHDDGDVADADGARSQILPREPGDARAECAAAIGDGWGGAGALANSNSSLHDGRGNVGSRGRNEYPDGSAWSRHEWLLGADGKARRVEPGIRLLVDGSATVLARMRAIEASALEEIIGYGDACGCDADEVLRMVRSIVCAAANWQAAPVGVREQLHAPSLLLDFLLCIEAARNRASKRSGFEEASAEIRRRIVLGVRNNGTSPGGPSRQWHCDGQRSEQSSDALLALSLVLARLAETYRTEARNANAASDRVAKLRAFGNAIVPQVAAEVLKAYLDCRP